MFVDEFHEYKSYPVVTALGQVKGVPTGDSQRSINMMMRARYLQGLQKGGGLIAATGTPVSNSLVEAYIMAKFLQPEVLEDSGNTMANYASDATTTEPNANAGKLIKLSAQDLRRRIFIIILLMEALMR